jgi:hypothetical protein
MKLLRILLAVGAITCLAACGNSSANQSTSTVAETSLPQAPADCSEKTLDALGGRVILGCTGNWAAIEAPALDCTEHCFAFIFKWDGAKWNLKMRCDQYSTLYGSGFCSGMTGNAQDAQYTDTIEEFPPLSVSCELWPPNRYSFNVSETGCTPDPDN